MRHHSWTEQLKLILNILSAPTVKVLREFKDVNLVSRFCFSSYANYVHRLEAVIVVEDVNLDWKLFGLCNAIVSPCIIMARS